MSKELTDRASRKKVPEVEIGDRCPHCNGQLSITPVGDIRPADWSPQVLGLSDCGGSQELYFVKLAPTLKYALLAHIQRIIDSLGDDALGPALMDELHKNL